MASVLSEAQIRGMFGEPGKNIVTVPMPILGKVSCHKGIEYQLRGALGELGGRGLSHLISLDQWRNGGGCYVYRNMRGSTRLSHHSWGIAVDLNHQTFPQGSTKKQDRRLVEIFAKWGFVNGEVFSKPDPMHFEVVRRVQAPGKGGELTVAQYDEVMKKVTELFIRTDIMIKQIEHLYGAVNKQLPGIEIVTKEEILNTVREALRE